MIRRYKLLFSLFNAVIALIVFFLLQRSHVLPGDTSKLFYLGPVIKNQLLPDEKVIPEIDHMIINTSYDRMLVDFYQTIDGRGFPRGNVAITDRHKILKLFELLNTTDSYKYIVCNLAFDQASPVDDSLSEMMLKTKRMVVARGYFQQKTVPQFQSLNYGLASVYMPSGTISKYRLFEMSGDSLVKSVPLKMYEDINGTTVEPDRFSFFSRHDHKHRFNDFTIENFIDFNRSSRDDLGRIITRGIDQFEELTRNKIILIGDFYNNHRKTIYDTKTPGLIILLNAYFSIENGSITIGPSLIIFLFVTFYFFSYLVLSRQSKRKSWIFRVPVLGSLMGGAKYIVAFALVGIVIYFLFGCNLNLVFVGLFFYIENMIFNYKFHLRRLKRRMNLEKK